VTSMASMALRVLFEEGGRRAEDGGGHGHRGHLPWGAGDEADEFTRAGPEEDVLGDAICGSDPVPTNRAERRRWESCCGSASSHKQSCLSIMKTHSTGIAAMLIIHLPSIVCL
jgi:hypothetical protein